MDLSHQYLRVTFTKWPFIPEKLLGDMPEVARQQKPLVFYLVTLLEQLRMVSVIKVTYGRDFTTKIGGKRIQNLVNCWKPLRALRTKVL